MSILRSAIRYRSAAFSRRAFTTSRIALEANNFGMPALSPTMTEGGVVEWKFKEGDSYNAGDILLEIETDKAQIDVEAQDDGKLAKIYVQNGEKGIPVGKTIAVIAEPDDDLATLKLPEPVVGGSAPSTPAPAPPASEPTKSEPTTNAASKAAPSESTKANPKQTLLPSVLSLAMNNNMTAEQVLNSVPASGPNNRVTKGDILAYLGKIPQGEVDSITASIKKLEHLDLSNIKVKKVEAKPVPEKAVEKKVEETKPSRPVPPPPVVLKGLFTLAEIEGFKNSLIESTSSAPSTKQLVEKASKFALRDVPAYSAARKSVLNDPVFESIIAPSTRGLKPFEISIDYPVVPKKKGSAGSLDIYDILTSNKKPSARLIPSEVLTVSVTVNSKYAGGEKKAKVYLDRLGYYLSAGLGELLLLPKVRVLKLGVE